MSNLKETLMEYISEEHLIEMASDMIRIPSYDGIPEQETGVARYVKSVFDANGIPCELKEVADGRCNVIATLDSGNPGKTIMLNAHMDTVPPNGWEDALKPKVVDGKLYGRGATDPKGQLACLVEAVLAVKKSGALEKGKIILTGVIDEEQNGFGTIDVLESGLTADGAIVAETSNLKILTAQRGLEWLNFHFTGKAVHSCKQREGINAIAKAVAFINAMEEKLIPKIESRTHPLLKESTINYCVIHGGTQPSTVAGACDLQLDRRFLPYESYEMVLGEFQEILDELAAKDPDFKCEMSVCKESAMKDGYAHLPMETSLDDPLVTVMQDAVRTAQEEEPVLGFMPAWTDAGVLNGYGKIPTVVMGAGGDAAHAPNEYVPVDDMVKEALICALTAINFCKS